jgi:hypothetical protein
LLKLENDWKNIINQFCVDLRLTASPKYAPSKAYKNNVGFKKEAYSKGDTLVCSASFVLSQQGYNFEDSSQNITKPSGSNSKILLLYTIVNNKKYAEFNSIIELEEELRP